MKIELINKEVVENLWRNHGQFACVCYDTDEKWSEKVGKACQKDGHMSGSRCEYIKFKVSGVDRGTCEQALRHEIGVSVPYEYQDNYGFSDWSEMVKRVGSDEIVKNMASFRYIDKEGFKWEVPSSVKRNEEALGIYNELMEHINKERNRIRDVLVESGVSKGLAVQDANFVLPRATLSDFVIGFTPEALIHFCHKRLCVRSQEFIREMAKKMVEEVGKYNEEFASELVPQCDWLLWCPEGNRCCGKRKTRKEKLEEEKEICIGR